MDMPSTLNGELHRTAELLIDIVENQGIFFGIAFLYDSGYDRECIGKLLSILENKKGAINFNNYSKKNGGEGK